MTAMASRITGKSSICSTVYGDYQQRNINGPCHCPFVRGIHRWPMHSRRNGQLSKKIPFNDVIMVNIHGLAQDFISSALPMEIHIQQSHTVQCRNNAVRYLDNPHNRQSIGMRYILWVHTLINVMPESLRCYIKYHAILDRVITITEPVGTFLHSNDS